MLEISYYLASLILGFLILGAAVSIAIDSKNYSLSGFLPFYLSFSLLSFFHFLSEITKVGNYSYTLYIVLKNLENPLLLIVTALLIPRFVFGLFGLSENKLTKNIYLLGAVLIIISLFSLALGDPTPFKTIRILIKDIFFILIVLILSLLMIIHYKKQNDGAEREFQRKTAFLTLWFLPFIISDTFFLKYVGFKFFPLTYIAFGLLPLRHYHVSLNDRVIIPMQTETKIMILETFSISKFGLTQREIQVCNLLIEGKSYSEISTQLYISIHTVKTHAKNLYAKIGVKNRIELMRLTQEL